MLYVYHLCNYIPLADEILSFIQNRSTVHCIYENKPAFPE